MSQALYRKWRPARFEDVVGQEHVTRTLQQGVAAGRVGHAYLFCGPRGTGKTTSARLLAKAVNCRHEDPAQRPCNACTVCKAISEGRFLDLIEIDAASNTGVDDIRDLRDKINFSPSEGRFKVYIIDEVHMLSTAAFNALLKTLEEPPPHVKFVLATTEEHKVPVTIKSRCQQFNFRLLTVEEISGRLEWLAQQESITMEPEALAMIARQGSGSIRDAESLLDQLVVAPGDAITAERTQMVLGTASSAAITALIEAWLAGDGAAGLGIIHQALASGTDARQFCRQVVAYLRQLLLLQAAGPDLLVEGTAEEKADMLVQAERAPRHGLIEALKRFNEAAVTPAGSWQPQLPLELAFIELLPDTPMPAASRPGSGSPAAAEKPASSATTETAQRQPAEPQTVVATAAPDVAVAAAGTAAPVAEEAPKPSDRRLSLGVVTTHWRELVAQAGEQNKNLPALLNMGKPLATEGSTIVLGFDFPIFKDKFDNTPGAAQLLGEIISTLTGIHCSVRCVVTSEYTVPIHKEEFRALAQELGGVVHEEREIRD